MTPEQLDAAATIQAIAEEMRDSQEKHWNGTIVRRQGRRLLRALEGLTAEDATFCPPGELDPDAC